MSIRGRPSCRITVGEAYYELLDSYEWVKDQISKLTPDSRIEVTRWDNHKSMLIRVGSIDTLQQGGY